jgi:hypothetical protein
MWQFLATKYEEIWFTNILVPTFIKLELWDNMHIVYLTLKISDTMSARFMTSKYKKTASTRLKRGHKRIDYVFKN